MLSETLVGAGAARPHCWRGGVSLFARFPRVGQAPGFTTEGYILWKATATASRLHKHVAWHTVYPDVEAAAL